MATAGSAVGGSGDIGAQAHVKGQTGGDGRQAGKLPAGGQRLFHSRFGVLSERKFVRERKIRGIFGLEGATVSVG
jgi:hypothetical protein